jgi:hypothetical protein
MIGGPADFVGSFDTIFFHRRAEMQEARLPYASLMPAHGEGTSVAIADVDGDGRLEVLLPIVRQSDGAYVLVLGSPAVDHYGHGLTVALEKPSPGTRVELVAGGTKQVRTLYGAEGHCAAARTYAHFGCGDATSYDSITVTPPGGAPFILPGGPLDRAIFVPAP